MRIESFWAKGFRSLRDVRLDHLGAFNVFYGPNGSGKSNILEAMRVLFEVCRLEGHLHAPGEACDQLRKAVIDGGIIQDRDFYARDDSRTIVLGARLVDGENGSQVLASGPLKLPDLTIEFKLEWIVRREPKLWQTCLESNGQDLRTSSPKGDGLHFAALLEALPSRAYTLVNAIRELRPDDESLSQARTSDIAWHQRGGGLARLLFDTFVDSRPAFRRRFEGLRELLEGPPLKRPPFLPVKDAMTGRIKIHERLPEPNPEGLEIPIDLAGLGIAQIYVILAEAMFSGARTVGIEEPEAHLHAPTSGLHLRELLKRLVDDKYIDQLFIATHSNLFDLDPDGYWDVSLVDGATRVERKPLHEIDARHLYEPGPAKHALAQLLRYAPDDEVVFRRPDGAPVTAKEMLRLLQEDDETAVAFLRNLHGAALRVVRLDARKAEKQA